MEHTALIMDEVAVDRALRRITHEIIEQEEGVNNIILLGIKSRGVPLAIQLASNIKLFENTDVPVGTLDITIHRDDLTDEEKRIKASSCHIPQDITDKTIILVDDVLYTGRTVRAAIESVFSYGRPKAVKLAVLVDRGHRELPFRPDYVGKNVPTSKHEIVKVKIKGIDDETSVNIISREDN